MTMSVAYVLRISLESKISKGSAARLILRTQAIQHNIHQSQPSPLPLRK